MRRVWFGQIVSVFGDFLALFAVIAVISFRLHGTPQQITLVSISYMLPLALFGPIAGVFVDRWNVKATMIASDLARGCLAVALVFVNSIWGFYAIFFAISILSSFFMPAQSVTIRSIVPREGLLSANALLMQALQIGRIVSPAIAGAMVGSFGASACFWFDAASFGFSALMLSMIVVHRAPSPAQSGVKSVLTDLIAGMRFIFTHAAISFVTLSMAAALFAISCFSPLIAIYVRDLLAAGSSTFGILSSMVGVGMIAGTQAVPRLSRGRTNQQMVVMGLAIMAIAIYAIAAVRMPVFTGIGMFGMGFGVAFILAPSQALFQQETPPAMVGRVSASFMSVLTLSQITGLALSGTLAGQIGVRSLFVASATFLVGIAAFGYWKLQGGKRAAAAAP